MKLSFIGPPLSGKGTQAKIFVERLGLVHISTGDLFREAIKKQLEIGLQAKGYMDRGELVPDHITIAILKERLTHDDVKKGFVLDGFPRTVAQAEALDQLIRVDKVIYFELSEAILIERLMGRMSCSNCGTPYHTKTLKPKVEGICDKCGGELIHRIDDNIDSFKIRLEAFNNQTKPLVSYYESKKMLFKVDSSIGLENIYNKIVEVVK